MGLKTYISFGIAHEIRGNWSVDNGRPFRELYSELVDSDSPNWCFYDGPWFEEHA